MQGFAGGHLTERAHSEDIGVGILITLKFT